MEAAWQRDAHGRWQLRLRGTLTRVPPGWPGLPHPLVAGESLQVDAQALQGWSADLAAALWELELAAAAHGAHLDRAGLPAGIRELLALAEARPQGADRPRPPPRRRHAEAARTVAFLGEVLISAVRALRGRAPWPRGELLQQLDDCGPRSLAIVLLTCSLVGLMLAYMGGAQLGRIGAQGVLANVVAVGMVRELGGLMTGVILTGHVGAAFAAQLATMQAGEEVDALRVLGVDPITHLVLPRLLALVLMGLPLILAGMAAGIVAGWPAAVWGYGVGSAEYWQQCRQAMSFTHLWIGLFKGVLYTALVALAGCREGLMAGQGARAVGLATTAAVVKGLVWIVAAACATTVFFTGLGY